jgi:hypothetical protein
VTDPTNNSKWQSGTVSAEWKSDDPPQIGSTFNWITSFLGRRIEGEMVMTSWDPPMQSGFKTFQGPIPFEVTTRYEAQGDGTRITTEGQVEFNGFLKLAERLVGKQLDKQIESNNGALKLLLEAG